ncbi:MAG: hypothetical protein HOB49_05260, partial [Gemmatimonadetes bacterium]|nr:hypothetical protein [Gemmatimonadota bacterium]
MNRTEVTLCGTGAVTSIAAAQGVTAAGGRAAVLLDSEDAHGVVADITGAWIAHRRRCSHPDSARAYAFELLAGDAQQAVDHCLVAHRLAASLKRPGLCDVDADIADDIALVQLPTEATDLLRVEVNETRTDVLAAAREAFAAVGHWTGRPCSPVRRRGPDTCRYAIVTTGAAWAQACAAAQLLSAGGIDCTIIGLALLSPVPVEELRSAIGDAEAVVVLDHEDSRPGELATLVQSAWQDRGERQVHVLPRGPAIELAQALRQSFGITADMTLTVPVAATQALTLGVVPAGAWADSLLLDVAAASTPSYNQAGMARPCLPGISALSIGAGSHQAQQLDLLTVAHHSLLTLSNIQHLRPGATVLILSEAEADGPAPALAQVVRDALRDAGVRALWLPVASVGPAQQDVRTAYEVGAILGCCDQDLGLTGDEASHLLQPDACDDARSAGSRCVLELPEAAAVGEPKTMSQTPDEPPADVDSEWVEALRRFHVTGRGAVSAAEPVHGLPLRPWALASLLAAEAATDRYPAVVEGDDLLPFVDVARAGLEGVGDLLTPHVARLASVLESQIDGGAPRALTDTYAEARSGFVAGLDLSPVAATALAAELDALGNRLAPAADVIGLGPQTLIELLARAAAQARRARIHTFHEDVLQLSRRLEERLRLDADLDGTRTPAGLSAALGGALQIDVPSLANSLKVRRGSQRLGEPRRQRMAATLAHLRQFVDIDEKSLPNVVLLHPAHIDPGAMPDGVTAVAHDVGMEAAAGYFEASARDLVDLFRAVRTARLEADDRYVPAHDAALERMDWQTLDPEELALVPPVFVLESADRVLSHAMSALSTLLRSGRPLHLIILDSSAAMVAEGNAEGLALAHPDLGFLAVAHRDALVLQTSLALPVQLYRGLGQLASSLRPSVAVVAVPDWEQSMVAPWTQLTAARYGRGTPDLLYDPDRGDSWSKRFDLTTNPQPDELWPRLVPRARDGAVGDADDDTEMDEAFTFAHAAALSPHCRHAFRVIPTQAWSAEQVPIDEYLQLAPSQRSRRLPYLWIVANDGGLKRAVMTREMAYASADRLQQWRTLQELGGYRNEYVQQATAEVQDLADDESRRQRDVLQRQHEEKMDELRQEVAREAVGKLANALLSKDGQGLPTILAAVTGDSTAPASVAVPADAETPAAPVEKVKAEEEPPPEPEVKLGEGFIDSPLCTSCHDCINMNPR